MTAEDVSKSSIGRTPRIMITALNIHGACNNMASTNREWRDTDILETINPMASKKHSLESTDEIAHRLQLTRQAFHMKKAAWCRFVGISPAAWNNVEGSKYLPALNRISLDQALLVCRATGVSLDWIYRGTRDTLPLKVAMELQALESVVDEAISKASKPRKAS